jgi:RimJ/RimL family protein N-acetyltransferase
MKESYNRALVLWRKVLLRERIFVFEKLLPAHPKIGAKVEFDARLAQSTDISKLTQKFGARIKEVIRKGHLCFIAKVGGEIVHFKMVGFGEVYVSELKREIHLDSNSAYIYFVYTVQSYRCLGLDSKVTTKVFDYLSEKGIEKVYILVRHNNFPELRVVQKVGYRKVGEITFIQRLSYKKLTYEGVTEKDRDKIKEMFLFQL